MVMLMVVMSVLVTMAIIIIIIIIIVFVTADGVQQGRCVFVSDTTSHCYHGVHCHRYPCGLLGNDP